MLSEGIYYAGIRIVNNLLSDLKSLMNKIALKWYLNTRSLYSVDEYLLSKIWLIHVKVV
jgi:hypothetical protein